VKPLVDNIRPWLKRFGADNVVIADAAKIWVFQCLTVFLGLIGGIIIARVLGPREKGVVDLYVLLTTMIADIGGLGVSSGLLFYLAKRNNPPSQIHGAGIIFALFVGAAAVIVGWFALSFLKGIFSGLAGWAFILAFTLSPALFYDRISSNILVGLDQAVFVYVIGAILAAASLLAVIFLYVMGILSSSSMIIASAVLAVLSASAFFVLLSKKIGFSFPSLDLFRKSIGYGLVVYFGVVANLLHFKIDQLMINHWLGAKSVGIYAVGVRWAEMLFFLDSAIGAAALHRISSCKPLESFNLANSLVKKQLGISGGAGLILIFLASPIISLVYGAPYQDAALPLMILVPGVIFWSASKLASCALVYNQGEGKYISVLAIVGMLTNAGLNVLFIGGLGYGIAGAAAASSLTYMGVAAAVYWKFSLSARRLVRQI